MPAVKKQRVTITVELPTYSIAVAMKQAQELAEHLEEKLPETHKLLSLAIKPAGR